MLDTPSSLGGRTTISHDPIVHSAIDHQRSSDRRLRQPLSGGRNGPDSHNAWTKDWGQVRSAPPPSDESLAASFTARTFDGLRRNRVRNDLTLPRLRRYYGQE